MSLKKYSYLLCKTELKAKLMAPMIDGDDNDMGNDEKLENNAVGEFKEFLNLEVLCATKFKKFFFSMIASKIANIICEPPLSRKLLAKS